MKLSEAAIAIAKRNAVGKSEHIEWDDKLGGFGLRVRNGRCTWIVQYKIGTQNRRVTLGTTEMLTAEQARNGWTTANGERRAGAAKIMVDARDGLDAAAARADRRKEASHTMGIAIFKYLEAKQNKLRPRSYQSTKRDLGYCSNLHRLQLSSITRADIASEISALAKRSGPAAANHARGTLSALFRWAIGEGLCDENPVVGTNTQAQNGPRERSLSDAEAAAIWLAAPENDYGRILKLLMLTGCRRSEIGSLEWSEIDLEARTITLPKHRTKNGQEHVVPLCDSAVAVIESIPRRDRDHVFGIGVGGFGGWAKWKSRIDETLQFKTPWTVHDVRRTVRTGLGTLGVAPHIAEAVLNHLPAKLVRTYDRNRYEPEKRAALDAWATHLAVAVAQATGANVTTLRPVTA